VSLSVTCMTYRPAGAAAVLALLRPLADEIVVALDDRVAPGAEEALAPVADAVVRYPYAEPVERPWAWLHAQCTGDWVLTIDDDEIPGAALLAALPDLIGARDVTHYLLPCWWLFPTADRYLAARPWWPDYHVRFVLNDVRFRSFPGRMHIPIAAAGPGRYLEAGFYHADLLLTSEGERERKAARYEGLLPGRRVAGRPLNDAYYLPERVSPPTRDVPAEDREAIERVLRALQEPTEAAGGEQAKVATRGEVDRHWAGRGLTDYAARVTPVEPIPPLRAGAQEPLLVRVENLGGETWPWAGGGLPEVTIGTRWVRDGGSEEGPRMPLPAPLGPGGAELVPIALSAPPVPGRYTLELDLVHEHVRWFECPTRVEAEVAPRRLVAVLDPGSLDELASVLERLDPEEEPVVLTPRPEETARAFAGIVRSVPDDPGRRLAWPWLVGGYRRALAGVERLVVPAGLLERGRRLPLLAAVAAARSLRVAAESTAGAPLTTSAVLKRR
jgi:hypothetical protein